MKKNRLKTWLFLVVLFFVCLTGQREVFAEDGDSIYGSNNQEYNFSRNLYIDTNGGSLSNYSYAFRIDRTCPATASGSYQVGILYDGLPIGLRVRDKKGVDHNVKNWSAPSLALNQTVLEHVDCIGTTPYLKLGIPTRSGYTFTKWTISPDRDEILVGDYTYINIGCWDKNRQFDNTTITVTANWKKNPYYGIKFSNIPTGATIRNLTSTWDLYPVGSTRYAYNCALPANTVIDCQDELGYTYPTLERNFTVTLNANGGTCSTSKLISSLKFNGWTITEAGGSLTGNFSKLRQTYASSNEYYIFTANANSSQKSVILPTPTRSGYIFNGWYTAASGGTKVSSPYTPSSNTTLYAHWTKSAYTLTVTKGTNISQIKVNGTAMTANSQTYTITAGSSVVIETVREGKYSFNKWNPSGSTAFTESSITSSHSFKNEKGATVSEADSILGTATTKGSFTMPSANVSVTPSATIKTFTVTYAGLSGASPSSISTGTHNAGSTVTVTGTEPIKSGFQFGGWHGDDGNNYKKNDTFVITKNVILTAQWGVNKKTVRLYPNKPSTASTMINKTTPNDYTVELKDATQAQIEASGVGYFGIVTSTHKKQSDTTVSTYNDGYMSYPSASNGYTISYDYDRIDTVNWVYHATKSGQTMNMKDVEASLPSDDSKLVILYDTTTAKYYLFGQNRYALCFSNEATKTSDQSTYPEILNGTMDSRYKLTSEPSKPWLYMSRHITAQSYPIGETFPIAVSGNTKELKDFSTSDSTYNASYLQNQLGFTIGGFGTFTAGEVAETRLTNRENTYIVVASKMLYDSTSSVYQYTTTNYSYGVGESIDSSKMVAKNGGISWVYSSKSTPNVLFSYNTSPYGGSGNMPTYTYCVRSDLTSQIAAGTILYDKTSKGYYLYTGKAGVNYVGVHKYTNRYFPITKKESNLTWLYLGTSFPVTLAETWKWNSTYGCYERNVSEAEDLTVQEVSEIFTLGGYHSDGWGMASSDQTPLYTGSEKLNTVPAVKVGTEDVASLYAIWNPNTYTVNFYGTKGTIKADNITEICGSGKNYYTKVYKFDQTYAPETIPYMKSNYTTTWNTANVGDLGSSLTGSSNFTVNASTAGDDILTDNLTGNMYCKFLSTEVNYTIRYHYNNGTSGYTDVLVSSKESVNVGCKNNDVTAPITVAYSGHALEGWTIGKGYGWTEYQDALQSDMLAESQVLKQGSVHAPFSTTGAVIHLYGLWEPAASAAVQVSVIYHSHYGYADDETYSETYTYSNSVKTATIKGNEFGFAVEHCVFNGWVAIADTTKNFTAGNTVELLGAYTVNNEIHLDAKWSGADYLVQYYDYSGTKTYSEYQPLNTDYVIKTPEEVSVTTPTGNHFTSWKHVGQNSNYDAGEVAYNTLITGCGYMAYSYTGNPRIIVVNLYAQKAANTYQVVFHDNLPEGMVLDADYSLEGETMDFTYGTSASLTAAKYTDDCLSGYKPKSPVWNTKADGNGTPYADKASVSNLTADDYGVIHLYAQWNQLSFTINYDHGVGSGTPNPYTQTGVSLTKSGEKTGVTFVGNDTTNFIGPTYTVKFETNGGTIASGSTMKVKGYAGNKNEYGETTKTISSNQVSFNGGFDGWEYAAKNTKFDIGFHANPPFDNSTISVNLSAMWYGEVETVPTPTRTGYTFVGWYVTNTPTESDLIVCDETLQGTDEDLGRAILFQRNEGDKTVTLYAKWELGAKPTASLTATNDLAETQTMTLQLDDASLNLTGYYFGTNADYTQNTYTTITAAKTYTTTKTADSNTTYYLTAKNEGGAVSNTVSMQFHKTILNGNGGTVDYTGSFVLTAHGKSITFPKSTRTGYHDPVSKTDGESTHYATSASAASGNTNITVAADQTYYALWAANTYTVRLYPNRPTSPKSISDVTHLVTNKDGWTWSGSYYAKTFTYGSTELGIKQDEMFSLTGYSAYNANAWYGDKYANGQGKGTAYGTNTKNFTSTQGAVAILYATWEDLKPTASLTAANDTATLSGTDTGSGIASYYFGTTKPTASNIGSLTFTSVTCNADGSWSGAKTVTEEGTYYLVTKDKNGKTSNSNDYTFSEGSGNTITFYKLMLDPNGSAEYPATVSPDNYIVVKGTVVTLPNAERTGFHDVVSSTEGKSNHYTTVKNGTDYMTTWTATKSQTLYAAWGTSSFIVRLYPNRPTNPKSISDVSHLVASKDGWTWSGSYYEKAFPIAGEQLGIPVSSLYSLAGYQSDGKWYDSVNTNGTGTGTEYVATDTITGSVGDTITLYAGWEDLKPTAKATAETNTATLSGTDTGSGIASYYFGTTKPTASNIGSLTFASVTCNTDGSWSDTKTISSAGTYYLITKDKNGKISAPDNFAFTENATDGGTQLTFYKLTLDPNGSTEHPASVTPDNYIVVKGTTVSLPTATRSGYHDIVSKVEEESNHYATTKEGTDYMTSWTATKSQTLYARWGTSSFTVRLYPNRPTNPKSMSDVSHLVASKDGWTWSGNCYEKDFPYSGEQITVTPSALFALTGYQISENWYSAVNANGTGAGTAYATSSVLASATGDTVNLYAGWEDLKPTASLSVTNNLATSQTVTLSGTDTGSGIASYYWGTTVPSASNIGSLTFTGVTCQADGSWSGTTTVSGTGVYYLITKDKNGKTSEPTNFRFTEGAGGNKLTFYQTTLNGNHDYIYGVKDTTYTSTPTVSIAYSINALGSKISPTASRAGNTYLGWNTNADSTSASEEITVNGDATYYAIWKDGTKPVVVIESITNNATTSQTVTFSMYDTSVGGNKTGSDIASYYWGTKNSPSASDFVAVVKDTTNGWKKNISISVTASGTYYLFAKDEAGNVSNAATYSASGDNGKVVFFDLIVDPNGSTNYPASVSPHRYLVVKNATVTLPTAVRTGFHDTVSSTDARSNHYTTIRNGSDYMTTWTATKTQTLYAAWSVNTYTVYLYPNKPSNPTSLSEVTIKTPGNDWTWDNTNKRFYRVIAYGGKDGTAACKLNVTPNGAFDLTGYCTEQNWYTGVKSNGLGDGTTYTKDSYDLTATNGGTVTLYPSWIDNLPEKVNISSTNNMTTSQSIELDMEDDGSGIAYYYWGTNSNYTSNPKTAVNAKTCKTTKTVDTSSGGMIWYLTVEDKNGKVRTAYATFTKSTIQANGDSAYPAYVQDLSKQTASAVLATYITTMVNKNDTSTGYVKKDTENAITFPRASRVGYHYGTKGTSSYHGEGYKQVPLSADGTTFYGYSSAYRVGDETPATSVIPKEDATYLAAWEVNHYSVIAYANLGTITGSGWTAGYDSVRKENYVTKTVSTVPTEKTEYVLPNAAVRTGYVMKGYQVYAYTDSNGSTKELKNHTVNTITDPLKNPSMVIYQANSNQTNFSYVEGAKLTFVAIWEHSHPIPVYEATENLIKGYHTDHSSTITLASKTAPNAIFETDTTGYATGYTNHGYFINTNKLNRLTLNGIWRVDGNTTWYKIQEMGYHTDYGNLGNLSKTWSNTTESNEGNAVFPVKAIGKEVMTLSITGEPAGVYHPYCTMECTWTDNYSKNCTTENIKTHYPESASDSNGRFSIIGDATAPLVSGLAPLLDIQEGLDITNLTSYKITVKADETQTTASGLCENSANTYMKISNVDNLQSLTLAKSGTKNTYGRIPTYTWQTLDFTKKSVSNGSVTMNNLLNGDFNVDFLATDNVGNTLSVNDLSKVYSMTATLESQTYTPTNMESSRPLFKKGEAGHLTLITTGYANAIKLEFPKDWYESQDYPMYLYWGDPVNFDKTKLKEVKSNVFYLDTSEDEAYYEQNENGNWEMHFIFLTPLYAEYGIKEIKATAYKGNLNVIEHSAIKINVDENGKHSTPFEMRRTVSLKISNKSILNDVVDKIQKSY